MLNKGLSVDFVQKICVFYILIWAIAPPLQLDMIFRLAALGAFAVWFILTLWSGYRFSAWQIIAVYFAVLVALIAYLASHSLSGVLGKIALYIAVICFILNIFYSEKWNELRLFIPVVLIALAFFNFKSFSVVLQDPTIARSLVRNDENTFQYLRQGVGGYSLIYPQVCVFPALLAWIIKARKIDIKRTVIGCIWLVSFILYLFNAGYSIAIVATAIGAFILFVYRGKNPMAAFVISMLLFGGAMLAILYLDGFRDFLLNMFDGTAVAKKINDLVSTSESGETADSISSRIDRYWWSISTILHYPIIGALNKGKLGNHSAVIDTFAQYGLWGGYIYCKMIYYAPMRFSKDYAHNNKILPVCNASLISILFVSFLDSFPYSIMPMLLIFIPILLNDIVEWTDKKHEHSLDS